MGWRNRPTFIDKWPDECDSIMFIDENGDASLKNIEKNINTEENIKYDDKFFTVTGCIIRKEHLATIRDSIVDLKNNHWNDGKYDYKGKKGVDKTKRVVLHSGEIRGKKGPFSPEIIDYGRFQEELTVFIDSLPIKIFSSTMDKLWHYKNYKSPEHPYSLMLEFIVERYANYYLKSNEKGIVILEARGKDEDKEVLGYMKNFIDYGTRYYSPEKIQRIKGVYFNPKWQRESDEQLSYFGLEITDLCSYPIHKFVKHNTKDIPFMTVEPKIHMFPKYYGKGLKVFPKK